MPTKSPYATVFKSAIKRGTPCFVVVNNIAKNKNTTPSVVFNSLFKAGIVDRQKFNGKWIYWPVEGFKGNSTNKKNCQNWMWQHFIDWCIVSGFANPNLLTKNKSSQQAFMRYCKKFFSKQFSGSTSSTSNKKRKVSSKSKSRKTTSSKRKSPKTTARKRRTTTGRTYKISKYRKGGTTRKYRRAA